MSIQTAALHAPKLNPINSVTKEIGYRAYELKDKLKNWSRVFMKRLASFKPVSKDFNEVVKSKDNLAQEYRHKPSGLKIFNINDTNSKLTQLRLTVKLPETEEERSGSAHFFEHMAMKNIGAMKKDIVTWAEENGVECNAQTTAKDMAFYFNLPDEKIQPVLNFFGHLYSKEPWNYDEGTLEAERKVIQGERIGYDNKPFFNLIREVAHFLKGKRHYNNKNLLGTEEDINKINVQNLENIRKAFNSAESTLKIDGPNSKLVDSMIHKSFQDVEAKVEKLEKLEIDYEKEIPKTTKKVFKHHDLTDGQMIVYYPDRQLSEDLNLSEVEKRKISNFIWISLFMGNDSRLKKVFNKEKINHGLTLMNYDHENKGLISVSTIFTDKKLFPKISSIINKEFKKLSEEGLSKDELDSIKTILENSFETSKEDPADNYRAAIKIAEQLEEDNWIQFTEEEALKYLQNVTKDEKSLAGFNEKLKAFVNAYLIHGKQKVVEQHNDTAKPGNVRVSDGNMGDLSQTTENHYQRPVAEFKEKHILARMPWDKVSFSKLDDKTYFVNDKQSNIARLKVYNPSGLMTLIDPKTLASGDKEKILMESLRNAKIASLAFKLFHITAGAKEELNPENLSKKFKKLGTSFSLDAGLKAISFSLVGIKKNIPETLSIFKDLVADPALLSEDREVQARVEQKFNESIEKKIRSLSELKDDRDKIVYSKFQNLIFKDQPENQSLSVDKEIELVKSIKLDEVRDFFKKYIIFDDQMKVVLNNSAQEAGLSGDVIQAELKKINSNDKRNEKTPEIRSLKSSDIPVSETVLMNNKLDKVGSSIVIGNLTEDLSKLSPEDRKLLSMSMDILGEAGLHSHLASKFRENGVYHWNMKFSLPDDSLGTIQVPQRMFNVSCECEAKDTEKIRKLIKDSLKEFLEKGPEQSDIEKIQNRLNLDIDDSLRQVSSRMGFFELALLKNKAPKRILNLANRFYDAKRAKELLKMVIKPDNFIEVVDNPFAVANNIVPFQREKKLQVA